MKPTKKYFTELYPKLADHIKEGNIFVSGDGVSYIGVAARDEEKGLKEVELGIVGQESTLEKYLDSHSQPNNW